MASRDGGRSFGSRSGIATRGRGSVRGGTSARSGRGSVRHAGTGRGGDRYASARRGGVRYSGRGGYYHGRRGGRYGYGHGGYYGGWGCGGWGRPWGGGYYWGYPCGGLGWAVGVGIGVGLGWSVAYWDPWYYDCYGSYWVNGAPPFGFGTVNYGPTYNQYFVQEDEYDDQVVVPGEVMPEGEPVVQPPDAPNPEDAPGYAEFGAGVQAFLDGDYPGALKQFRLAAQADENNGEAWMAIAQSAFAVGAFDQSAEGITRAAELGAFPRGYRYDPSPMYPQEGRFEKLFERLETFRVQHPTHADGHLVAAYFFVALGEKGKANEAIVQVLELRPDDEAAPVLTMAMLPPVPPQKLAGPENGDAGGAAPAKQPDPAPDTE